MKTLKINIVVVIALVLCSMVRAQTATQSPNLTQPLLKAITPYIDVPIVYECNPRALGVLARVQIGSIKKLGCDIDTLAGAALPTSSAFGLSKGFSNLTGQAGFGASWSWTLRNSPYFVRAGVGVLEAAGTQPNGSVYIMFGSH